MVDREDSVRLAVLEEKVEDLLEAGRDTQKALQDLTKAIIELASIKSDHERHASEINTMRQRQHAMGNELARISLVERDAEHAKAAVAKLERDMDTVKRVLPNMELASGWVFKAVLAVMGILGLAALGTLLKGGIL